MRSLKKYELIRGNLNTGDLVFFSGSGFISRIIQVVTKSKWSHVGMVIRSVDWDMLLLWESTTLSKIKDVESREQTQGVQLVPLSERIKCYKEGNVAFRHLVGLECGYQKYVKDTLKLFREEVKGRPYEESKVELFKSAYDGLLGDNEEDLSSIFCSELVAEGYQRLGFLSEDVPSNEYTPKDLFHLEKLVLPDVLLGLPVYV